MKPPWLQLNDAEQIPQIGLGLWKVKDKGQFDTAFKAAIEGGYRHFDTAQAYGNEKFLGAAWRSSQLQRNELFITTKIHIKNFGPKHLSKSFEESLKNLQTDYVDLLLLHYPVPFLHKKAWQTLESIKASGCAKNIGVSNYTPGHLQMMQTYAKLQPAVNQVELHLFCQQAELVKYCHDAGILIEAYSPLAHAQAMDDKTVAKIAQKHHKSYAQVMLRWLIQQELVVLPKSVNPKRLDDNMAVFDFELDGTDMQALKRLDRNQRTAFNGPLRLVVGLEILATLLFRRR